MPASVLVTGGAGFIGGEVVRRLAAGGARVVAVDSMDPSYPPEVKRAHWAEVARSSGAAGPAPELVEADVRDADALARVFARARFGAVVHLAARAGVRASVADPAGYSDVNVTGTARVLEACRAAGVVSFVFASSSSVYGASPPPFSENAPADRPFSPYAATKRAGELLAAAFAAAWGWRAIALRVFTAYGPWQRPDLAIHRFTRALIDGETLTVFGDGSTTRAYTHVDDITDGIVHAVDWATSPAGGTFEVVNLGTARGVRLDRLVATLERLTGRRARVERAPVPPGDAPATAADGSKARTLLGWEPRVDLEEGLAGFVEWMRSRPRPAPRGEGQQA